MVETLTIYIIISFFNSRSSRPNLGDCHIQLQGWLEAVTSRPISQRRSLEKEVSKPPAYESRRGELARACHSLTTSQT